GETPRSVEPSAGNGPTDESPVQPVGVDEPETWTGDLIPSIRILLRVGDEDPVLDPLDPERCVSVGKLRIEECARFVDKIEVAVEDVNAAVVKVGRIQEIAVVRGRNRQTLVNSAGGRQVNGDH